MNRQKSSRNSIGNSAPSIKLSFVHTRDALRRELIEGQENTWSNIYSQRFRASQTYITGTYHSFQGYMLITSKDFWDGLPTDIRGRLERF
ncbi:MAG: hypothetical protein IPL99_28905 [Candidatus Competibacteraceae bacterium]|nr:hypothetical protein [Candidatus Competibacteraceae bacterium]